MTSGFHPAGTADRRLLSYHRFWTTLLAVSQLLPAAVVHVPLPDSPTISALVADGAMWPHLVAVPCGKTRIPGSVVEAHEPVLVQAFHPGPAIEGPMNAFSVGSSRSVAGVCPRVQLARDELAAL